MWVKPARLNNTAIIKNEIKPKVGRTKTGDQISIHDGFFYVTLQGHSETCLHASFSFVSKSIMKQYYGFLLKYLCLLKTIKWNRESEKYNHISGSTFFFHWR